MNATNDGDIDGLFWIDPYKGEPLGPGAFCTPEDRWTVYGDDMTFKWKGGRSIHVYDQCRNFRLFEVWTFTNRIPTFEEVERAIRRRIRQYTEWQNAHPKDYLGDENPAAFLIRWLPEVRP